MSAQTEKLCFVTVGATSAFTQLVRGVLADSFLRALAAAGYRHLRIQYGKDGQTAFQESVTALGRTVTEEPLTVHGVAILGFDFKQEGLDQEVALAKKHGALEGLIVSHAGSGSILAALRVEVPLVVVPNASLLDNHQLELAEELARQGYVIHGRLDDLPGALVQAERLHRQKRAWPPQNGATQDPSGRGLMDVLDDEMGFVD